MEKVIYEPLLSGVGMSYRQSNQVLIPDGKIEGLFTVLTEKGMDCLTKSKIEHVICTSALAGFY
jgi:hypothetical protein